MNADVISNLRISYYICLDIQHWIAKSITIFLRINSTRFGSQLYTTRPINDSRVGTWLADPLLITFLWFSARFLITISGAEIPSREHEPSKNTSHLSAFVIWLQGLGQTLPSAGNNCPHLHVVSIGGWCVSNVCIHLENHLQPPYSPWVFVR